MFLIFTAMSVNKYKSFQDGWLNDEQHESWLQKCDDVYHARCKVCSKNNSVAGEVVNALDDHAKGEKNIFLEYIIKKEN